MNTRYAGADRQVSSNGTYAAQLAPITKTFKNALRVHWIEAYNKSATDTIYLLVFDRATAVSGAEADFVCTPVQIPPQSTGSKTFPPGGRPFASGCVVAVSSSDVDFADPGALAVFDVICDG